MSNQLRRRPSVRLFKGNDTTPEKQQFNLAITRQLSSIAKFVTDGLLANQSISKLAERQQVDGGRFTSNYKDTGKHVLQSVLRNSIQFESQAQEVYLSLRRQQVAPVTADIFGQLVGWLQGQLSFFSKNPDLIERCIREEADRRQVYLSLLDQFCGYQVDFQDMLLKEDVLIKFAFPLAEGEDSESPSYHQKLQIVTVCSQTLNQSFLLLMRLKNDIIQLMGGFESMSVSDFLSAFSSEVNRRKEPLAARSAFKDRWSETTLCHEENRHWKEYAIASDLHTGRSLSEEDVQHYDLLKLIAFLNATRTEDYQENPVRQKLYAECCRRLSLHDCSADELVTVMQIEGAALNFPFMYIKEQVLGFVEQEADLAAHMAEERWQAIEAVVVSRVLRPDLLRAMTLWDLVDLYHGACKNIESCYEVKVESIEIDQVYQEIKRRCDGSELPLYIGSDELEQIQFMLSELNCYARKRGEEAIFSSAQMSALKKQAAISPLHSRSSPDQRGAYSTEAVVEMAWQAIIQGAELRDQQEREGHGSVSAKYIIAPLLHFIRFHAESLMTDMELDLVKEALFADSGLLLEMLPLLLNNQDISLAHALMQGYMQYDACRSDIVLKEACCYFGPVLRLGNDCLEKIVEGQLLVAVARFHAEDMENHLKAINHLFTQDIRAVFAYVDGMSELAYQRLLSSIAGINYDFSVKTSNVALQPYLLLRSTNSFKRALAFARALILEKKSVVEVRRSYQRNGLDDAGDLWPKARKGREWLAKLNALEQEQPSHLCGVKAILFQPAGEGAASLLQRIGDAGRKYRGNLTDSPRNIAVPLWKAKLKLLSAMSQFIMQPINEPGSTQQFSMEQALREYPQIERIAKKAVPGLSKVSFAHKTLSEWEIKTALHGSTCRDIWQRFVKVCREYEDAENAASSQLT